MRTKQSPLNFIVWEKRNAVEVNGDQKPLCHQQSSKYIILCSAEERYSYRFGTTRWGINNNDRLVIFGRTITLKLLRGTIDPSKEPSITVSNKITCQLRLVDGFIASHERFEDKKVWKWAINIPDGTFSRLVINAKFFPSLWPSGQQLNTPLQPAH